MLTLKKEKKRWGIYLEKPIQEAVCKTSAIDVSGHRTVLKYLQESKLTHYVLELHVSKRQRRNVRKSKQYLRCIIFTQQRKYTRKKLHAPVYPAVYSIWDFLFDSFDQNIIKQYRYAIYKTLFTDHDIISYMHFF